ncbi:AzlD domain-containing protein [Mesorhizobium sp. CU2]|uniref:AzlD domain-containing protein n=1 Tax=Mesorhizobium sp. CU3 TaxID=2589984 RepID=UPI00112798D7|nr:MULTISPECIES: AzlD domain-containing protein [unclassified Mesorhizobium]TPN88608.1 AzlD domain-containing protein [Mesorhizobium sp. CU3]TPO14720.1 AzlD domain-containing protein [Mesorhizobium sp. CU2]
MSYFSNGAWWWPYLFILVAGFAATDVWRFLGVYLGGKLSEDSDLLVLVRTMATALVAGVIGNLIVFPGGALAHTSFALRIAAAALGFAVYLAWGKRMIAGIATAELLLLAGLYLNF